MTPFSLISLVLPVLVAFTLNQRPCTFEQEKCRFWNLENNPPATYWQIRDAIMLENGDHTLGEKSGNAAIKQTS